MKSSPLRITIARILFGLAGCVIVFLVAQRFTVQIPPPQDPETALKDTGYDMPPMHPHKIDSFYYIPEINYVDTSYHNDTSLLIFSDDGGTGNDCYCIPNDTPLIVVSGETNGNDSCFGEWDRIKMYPQAADDTQYISNSEWKIMRDSLIVELKRRHRQ